MPPFDLTWMFVVAVAALGFVMKLVAMLLPARGGKAGAPFVYSPLVSPSSPVRARQPGDAGRLFRQCGLWLALTVAGYWCYWLLVGWWLPGERALGWMAAPILLLLAETASALVSLVWLPTGWRLPPLVNHPALTRGVTEFWSRRWNLWFSDWFRYAIFSRMRGRPVLALFAVFFVSGVMHEWVINVPLYFLTGRNCFGTMMIYFLLQLVAILIEKRFLANAPLARIALAWLAIVGPVPLLLNEGLLRAMGLWPGV